MSMLSEFEKTFPTQFEAGFEEPHAFPMGANDYEFLYPTMDSPPTQSTNLPMDLGFSYLAEPFGAAGSTSSLSTFGAPSPPARSYTPPDVMGSPVPYTHNLDSAETSDVLPSAGRGSRSSGSRSPPAVPYSAASVPRSHRFNPIAVPTSRVSARVAHKRRSSKSNDESDDEDDDFQPISNSTSSDAAARDSRRETVRKQRIESEQRRRDELREGYSRLKETLPASNQKASKVSLLDRATSHIKYLEAVKDQLEIRLKGADHEVHRLRSVNEALMLNRAGAANGPSSFTN